MARLRMRINGLVGESLVRRPVAATYRRRVVGAVSCLLVLFPSGTPGPGFADSGVPAEISYRQTVWPVLKRHCWGCHSSAKAEGGLKLDTVADMLKGGDSGPLFEPAKPDESLLVKMIAGPTPEMPKNSPPLSAEKVNLLKRWILAGAKDDSPPVPATTVSAPPAAYKYPVAVTSVSLTPDGKLAAAACRSEVVLVDIDGETPARRLPTDCDLLSHVEFSPDGSLMAAVGGVPGLYGEVRFLRVADGAVLSARRIGHDTLFRGSFSPDGRAIAVAGPDGAVHVVPVDAAGEVGHFELHSDWAFDVAYSPDGKLLVSAGRDKATKVSSADDGHLIRALDSSPDFVGCVACDEQFAVSAGRARTLIGYELKIAFQGIEIAGAGNGAQPVTRRDQYAKPFEGPPGVVLDLATSGDRKHLAVAGAFGEIRVYQLATRQRTATITGIPNPVFAVALNADGSRLAAGTKSGRLEIYDVASAKPIKSVVAVPMMPAPVEPASK
ncbi:MAG TPA: c-type cytochrome domain-containing protein [Pirellulales bacterium]|nr:c-type cytochrome domain-containing protein [Pirellulales bacterium]